jgi:hypothetical protein
MPERWRREDTVDEQGAHGGERGRPEEEGAPPPFLRGDERGHVEEQDELFVVGADPEHERDRKQLQKPADRARLGIGAHDAGQPLEQQQAQHLEHGVHDERRLGSRPRRAARTAGRSLPGAP